jgi:hypothetical protein
MGCQFTFDLVFLFFRFSKGETSRSLKFCFVISRLFQMTNFRTICGWRVIAFRMSQYSRNSTERNKEKKKACRRRLFTYRTETGRELKRSGGLVVEVISSTKKFFKKTKQTLYIL